MGGRRVGESGCKKRWRNGIELVASYRKGLVGKVVEIVARRGGWEDEGDED